MKTATLVFPHQLFETHPALRAGAPVYLVEEWLYFRQFPFHKAKLAFHRASMKTYAAWLERQGFEVRYIESSAAAADIRVLGEQLAREGFAEVRACDPVDDWLERRMQKAVTGLVVYPSPMFLNDRDELQEWFGTRRRFFQTDFYTAQRKRRGLLLDAKGGPAGGKWSFDADNRRRWPRGKAAPRLVFPPRHAVHDEAESYVELHFADHYGRAGRFQYPITHAESRAWLDQFLNDRFAGFGEFEDAMVAGERVLNHSVLTPLLNAGLLTPDEVVSRTLAHAAQHGVPLNSVEGFIRQIIGWREFIRGVYMTAGRRERTRNFWGFRRRIPESFWTGTTGIAPVDIVVRKVLDTGYCHHIERLMVLGNFMLLCEFDPDEVYRWFMTLFVDAYDWVMVTNVYGMSQFADGGLMVTKPYISGSNYLMKMGDFPKGNWQLTWDALFWRFLDVHREFFLSNPRLGMLVRTLDKMDEEKRTAQRAHAEHYLTSLG